ncbi:MCE family protein [Gordonia rhizosphera]|uniref:Mce family protein n=1 Tax=Gordonia rhizosphera NBRC 16068 TaxID=1108045 RepID=K6WTL6_9ACTN|nr:MCE family protein [Gordonia rhizosphera]GAB89884.1 Mce family protein [Gordonia rhizosphera NBRC 16068]
MSKGGASVRKPLIGFSLFAVIALLLTYIIWSTLERSVPGDTDSYTTYFNDASGLLPGDDVRMAGVRVGRVGNVALDDGRARVVFDVQTDQTVFSNTKAAIRYQNLIGQRYLSLTLVENADSTPLSPGSTLQQPSEDSFDVTRLLAGFQPVFETLSPEEVNALSEGLVQAFQGDDVSLSYTVAQVGKLANDMANRDEVIGAIVDDLSGVLRDLARQGNQVGTLVDSIADLIENLNSNSAAFGKSVSQLGETASGFADVLGNSRTSLQTAASNALSATDTLIANGAKLDKLAVELPVFLGHFPLVLGQGAYLNIYACDLDIAIGDVLFPPGVINKIGGTKHSEVCR